ncbi:MAG: DUF2183 domain-containing protein [Desulfobacteraceae bacterium]|nr:MAG: DUF2183 domain-containing protein [Desulfobacteraceae bacterium]
MRTRTEKRKSHAVEKFFLMSMVTIMNRKSNSRTIPADSLAIIPFSGYVTDASFHFRGRVVEKSGVVRLDPGDTFLQNAWKMWNRFFIQPGRGVTVKVRFGSMHMMVDTTTQGFFRADLELRHPADQTPCSVELVNPLPKEPIQAVAPVFFPQNGARVGIISDIDDTIMYAHATNPLKMIGLLMFSNAATRQPFPGVRAFYNALHSGKTGSERNPFFYISSSSWQMYDIIQDFIDIHGLPRGPIFLRELPFTGSMKDPWRHGYKLWRIREILESYPTIPFILLGDSGQRDVEIYSLIARSFPGRIPVLYIRDVLPCELRRTRIAEIAAKVKEEGSELVLLNDTISAAAHAASKGWIPAESLPGIARDQKPNLPLNSRKETMPLPILRFTTRKGGAHESGWLGAPVPEHAAGTTCDHTLHDSERLSL